MIDKTTTSIQPSRGKINGAELSAEDKTTYQLTRTTTGKVTNFKLGEVLEVVDPNTNNQKYVYFVEESTVPDGYMVKYGELNQGNVSYRPDYSAALDDGYILNQESSGYELPETGGIGTTLFTALGGLMTVTAGAILTMRRGKRKPMEG